MFTGLISDLGSVSALERSAGGATLAIRTQLAAELQAGDSLAVNGVSLTASALGGRGFSVSLIPATLRRTSLGRLTPGALVNIEVDVLAKHLERLVASPPQAAAAGGGR